MHLPARPDQMQPTASPGAMRYRVRHVTAYDYGELVPLSHHLLHLTARPHARQRVRRSHIRIDPAASVRSDHIDYFGNRVTYVAVEEPHRHFAVTADTEVEIFPPCYPDPAHSPAWQLVCQRLGTLSGPDDGPEILQYAFDSPLIATSQPLLDYALPSFTPGRPVAEAAVDLMLRINADFIFDPTATTVTTQLAEAMRLRRGVCQDFAHILIGCLRSVGLPARYVSGYLRTLPPPGQPRLIGADVSHAWASVWCGQGLGWLDLCPTNARRADQDFITIAWGRDYQDVSPARGVLMGGAGHALSVSVDVEPV